MGFLGRVAESAPFAGSNAAGLLYQSNYLAFDFVMLD
jgi:hypothetical protein